MVSKCEHVVRIIVRKEGLICLEKKPLEWLCVDNVIMIDFMQVVLLDSSMTLHNITDKNPKNGCSQLSSQLMMDET